MLADYYGRDGEYLGNDGVDDGKIYLLKEGVTANKNHTEVNWGGKLDVKHSDKLKQHSDEVGGLIVMNRTEEGTGFTISDFTTTDSGLSGYMLEPDGPATTDSGKDKRIPAGVYDLRSIILQAIQIPGKSRIVVYPKTGQY